MRVLTMTLAACLIAGPAFASCSQSDIKGNWNAYSVGAEEGSSYWVKCSITIEGNGDIAEGSTSCADSFGDHSKMFGSIKVKSQSECTYDGTVHLTLDGEKDKLSEITLNRDHNSASGVGISPNNGFSFTLVRN